VIQVINYHGQILAMNECGYRQMYDAKYLLTQDIDEFVVPKTAKDWLTMLRLINDLQPQSAEHIASYGFRHRFFPLEFQDVVDQVSLPVRF